MMYRKFWYALCVAVIKSIDEVGFESMNFSTLSIYQVMRSGGSFFRRCPFMAAIKEDSLVLLVTATDIRRHFSQRYGKNVYS